jgi:hypothetical protein
MRSTVSRFGLITQTVSPGPMPSFSASPLVTVLSRILSLIGLDCHAGRAERFAAIGAITVFRAADDLEELLHIAGMPVMEHLDFVVDAADVADYLGVAELGAYHVANLNGFPDSYVCLCHLYLHRLFRPVYHPLVIPAKAGMTTWILSVLRGLPQPFYAATKHTKR